MSGLLSDPGRARIALGVLVALTAACRPGGAAMPSGATGPAHAPPSAPGDTPQSAAADDAPASSAPRGRLGDDVVPLGYELEVEIDPDAPGFRGTITIELVIARPTSAVWLHAEDIRIHRAVLSRDDAEIILDPAARLDAPPGSGLLGLPLGGTTSPGRARLQLEFSAVYDDRTGVFRQRVGTDHYVFTDFEPIDARRAMPCFDDPRLKAPWRVSLIIPSGLRGLSNMPVERTAPVDGGRVRLSFAPTRPLPTYLVAFAVGPFDVVDAGSVTAAGEAVPVRVIAPRGKRAWAARAAEYAPPLLRAVADYFGQPVPFPKIDLIAVPQFNGAMENPGLITVASHILLSDPRAPSLPQLRMLALVCAHEFAHLWLGDVVTMDYWHELWLNEGLASWLADLALAGWDPDRRVPAEQAQSKAEAMEADSFADVAAVRAPVAGRRAIQGVFNPISYKKGGAIAVMVERWLSPRVFRDGLLRYVKAHADRTATTGDLVAALSAASDRDVGPVLRSFLDQPGVPLVRAELRCEGDAATVELSQEPYRLMSVPARPGDARRWAIPVCLRHAGARGGSDEQCLVLAEPRRSVRLRARGCPAWVMPNAGGDGYYRYAMPPHQLRELARAPLSEREATDLAHDLAALARGGYVRLSDSLPALASLAATRSRYATAAIVDVLVAVGDHLIDPAERPRYEQLVRALYGGRARALGFAGKPGESPEDALLRPELLRFVGRHGADPWVLGRAAALARRWLDTGAGVERGMLKTTLALAARVGDARLFDDIERKLGRAGLPSAELAAALGAFTRPDLVDRARLLLLDARLAPELAHAIALELMSDPTVGAETRAFLERSRLALERGSRQFLLVSPMFASALCDPHALELARALIESLAPPSRSQLAPPLRAAEHAARACERVRRHHAQDVRQYFRRWQ